jgi:hypothetical protein
LFGSRHESPQASDFVRLSCRCGPSLRSNQTVPPAFSASEHEVDAQSASQAAILCPRAVQQTRRSRAGAARKREAIAPGRTTSLGHQHADARDGRGNESLQSTSLCLRHCAWACRGLGPRGGDGSRLQTISTRRPRTGGTTGRRTSGPPTGRAPR